MTRRPPELVPGPADDSGAFVLIDEAPEEETVDLSASAPELAEGSDVHDVDDLEARLASASDLESVLRDYLDDPRDLPAPPGGRRRP